ncbi:MAG: hypothetical protein HC856_03680 [Pseudanabaena sp. RU_4_16]|nr:hypothetical protein [Pseudanabaena sp. RU_4_16]
MSRRQIDVGDRHYPMVIVFDRNGGLILAISPPMHAVAGLPFYPVRKPIKF